MAIIVGLDHGLGQSEELLRNGDLAEASRVRLFLSQFLDHYTDDVFKVCLCFPDSVPPSRSISEGLDVISNDETLQPERPQVSKSNEVKIVIHRGRGNSCYRRTLGSPVNCGGLSQLLDLRLYPG